MYFPTTFLTNLFLGLVSTMALGRGVVPLPRLILKFLLFFTKPMGMWLFFTLLQIRPALYGLQSCVFSGSP